jgi:hypothetical protein
MRNLPRSEFEKIAANEREPNLLCELWTFLRENKKLWLLPVIIVMLAFSLLIFLSGTGLAPFIYTLF